MPRARPGDPYVRSYRAWPGSFARGRGLCPAPAEIPQVVQAPRPASGYNSHSSSVSALSISAAESDIVFEPPSGNVIVPLVGQPPHCTLPLTSIMFARWCYPASQNGTDCAMHPARPLGRRTERAIGGQAPSSAVQKTPPSFSSTSKTGRSGRGRTGFLLCNSTSPASKRELGKFSDGKAFHG